jgi:hypothetical protein
MTIPFNAPLLHIQPADPYVDATALAEALDAWDPLTQMLPPPAQVAELDAQLVLIEGHGLALSAIMRGRSHLPVVWAPEQDDGVLRARVGWCLDHQVRTVVDLLPRVVPPAVFEEKWARRLREMQDAAGASRTGNDTQPEE